VHGEPKQFLVGTRERDRGRAVLCRLLHCRIFTYARSFLRSYKNGTII